MMIKNKALLFILLTFILFIGCSNTPIVNDLNDIEETIDIGNKIIEAANDYKNKYGTYPETLEELVPEYFMEVPKTKMKKLNDETKKYYVYREFSYGRHEERFAMSFNASLDNSDCYSSASDTCGLRFLYRSYGYDSKGINYEISQGMRGIYRNWLYFSYNNCYKKPNELECIFQKQLKSKNQKEVTVKPNL